MRRELKMLEEFHETYDCERADEPRAIDGATLTLRGNLIEEELKEYYVAALDQTDPIDGGEPNGDLTEIADALADLLYVVYGTVVAHGLQSCMPDLFAEVHRSNMSKLGADGKPIYRESDRKVMKGPNFTPPDIAGILEAWQRHLRELKATS